MTQDATCEPATFRNLNTLASLSSWAGWSEYCLVENTERDFLMTRHRLHMHDNNIYAKKF